MAMATITQGDFSVFGNLSSRWSGRWGEGSARNGTPTTFVPGKGAVPGTPGVNPGTAPTRTGGSFDFNHWDLVQARQVADIRPDYHIVKNYNLLGRLDTLVLKDADVFAVYRPWYDAFPDIKHNGVAQTARDWTNYNSQERVQQFVRDDLREYYGQLNFTDNFSARIGKQQVIWSEADALSGTDVTNPQDLRYHWTHFESPEDLRTNLRMIKLNYILPDFLKTANNELEFFVIPGDWEGGSMLLNTSDARSPYIVQTTASSAPPHTGTNLYGQPFRSQTLADGDPTPLVFIPPSAKGPFFLAEHAIILQKNLTDSIDNSEFGVRYSTLLPIGNGLQTSLIYLYEARSPKLVYCTTCTSAPATNFPDPTGAGYIKFPPPSAPPSSFLGVNNPLVAAVLGVPVVPLDWNSKTKNAFVAGTLRVMLRNEIVRQNYFDITGTYYDKDLTDIVFRYDFLYAPKTGINVYNGTAGAFTSDPGGRWTQETRWIVAGDRPTSIPWLSKQHTFLTFQNALTWMPDRPSNAVLGAPTDVGIVREISDLSFVALTNWLINGQLTALNVVTWDWDDQVGYLNTNNVYRYSRNVLFALNAIWYLGRSGRYTDPYIFSRDQRINEVEVRFTYEI
jgi:hypothetical protein